MNFKLQKLKADMKKLEEEQRSRRRGLLRPIKPRSFTDKNFYKMSPEGQRLWKLPEAIRERQAIRDEQGEWQSNIDAQGSLARKLTELYMLKAHLRGKLHCTKVKTWNPMNPGQTIIKPFVWEDQLKAITKVLEEYRCKCEDLPVVI